jgi:ABC-type glycerol-3-phosphate transport system permease component
MKGPLQFFPSHALRKIFLYSAAAMLAVIFLIPFYWTVVGSFKEAPLKGGLMPEDLTLEKYPEAVERGVLTWFLNSMIICVVITACQVLFGSMAGYAFAKKKFYGQNKLFKFFLSLMMVPFPAVMLAQWKFITWMGKATGLPIGYDSHMGVIWPCMASIFAVFMMRQYFTMVPDDLVRAARVDGCSEFKILTKVMLPVAKPAMLTLALFTFQFHWGNYLWQFMMLTSPEMLTLPVGQANVQFSPSPDMGVLLAMSTIAILPLLIFFIFMQRYFIEGATSGAVVG